MSRNAQLIFQIVQRVLRTSKGRRSWKMIALLAIGAVLYSMVLQPVLEKTLGISLPGISANSENGQGSSNLPPAHTPDSSRSTNTGRSNNTGQQSSGNQSGQHSSDAAPTFNPQELSDVLEEVGRNVYQTPAGLRYTRGSEHGHRVAHVLAHTRDEPNQQGQHGIFDEDDPRAVLLLIDQAYLQAKSGKRTQTKEENGRFVYNVNMGKRIGYVGGTSGKRRNYPSANYIRLVVQENRLITAFPVRL